MKNIFKYIIILVLIALAVVAGIKAIKIKQEAEAKMPVAVTYSLNVKTIQPKMKNTSLSLPYLATTKSNDDVKISSRVSARIKYIVKSGNVVTKGETIVKIDDKELKTQLESLNLNTDSLKSQLNSKLIALKNLENTHARTQKLLSVKGASQEEFDREITNIENAKSGIDTLKFKIQELKANKASINNMLSYTTIKSPVSGIVKRLANVGDIAMMGKPLISISTKSNSYLLVRLPSSINAKSIIYNKKVYSISALNTTFNGLLEYLVNIDESLASEQTINIDVVIFSGNGYKLPHDTILNRNGEDYVLIIKKDKATPRKVKIIANGEQGVVISGVNENDNIVVAKQDILLKLLTGIKTRAIK
jgi:RND family efflux transporter MFP subunit